MPGLTCEKPCRLGLSRRETPSQVSQTTGWLDMGATAEADRLCHLKCIVAPQSRPQWGDKLISVEFANLSVGGGGSTAPFPQSFASSANAAQLMHSVPTALRRQSRLEFGRPRPSRAWDSLQSAVPAPVCGQSHLPRTKDWCGQLPGGPTALGSPLFAKWPTMICKRFRAWTANGQLR